MAQKLTIQHKNQHNFVQEAEMLQSLTATYYRLGAACLLHKLAITQRELIYLHDPESYQQFAVFSPYRSNLSLSENKQRMTEFVQILNGLGYKWQSTGGTWGDPSKEKGYALEGSAIIYDMTFEDAIEVASHFNQEAILYKPFDGPLAYYDLNTHKAIVMQDISITPGSPRPRVKEEQGIEHTPSTRFRDTEVVYDFDFNQPIDYSGAALTFTDLDALTGSPSEQGIPVS